MNENAVKTAIIDFLQYKGFLVIRVNSGAVIGEYKGHRRFVRFAKWFVLGRDESATGISDILAFRDNVRLAIETKSPGRQMMVTPAQICFLDEWQRHGGISIVADSLDDFISKWEATNVGAMATSTYPL